MHKKALTNENAEQDTETIEDLHSQDTCMQEDTFTHENKKQDMEMETINVLHSPGNTDEKYKMTDVLHHGNIEKAIIALAEQKLETEASTNRNKMAKQSENNFDEQKEEATEAVDLLENTQLEPGIEFIYIKDKYDLITGTEKEGNLKKLCQPCQKNSNNVTACHWCLNCEEAFCEYCKENHPQEHKLEKLTLPHEVIKISNWCGDHPDRQYQYFCKNHHLLCCDECRKIEHRDCHVIVSIADASKGFISSEVVDRYKRILKTISKSFADLKYIIEKGRNDAETTTDNLQLKLERIGHHLMGGDQLMHFKELFPKHIKDERNICLSKLQKQLSVVYKCKNFINTIETSLESIMQQCHEEQVFRMVHISTKFLASTLKKAISDSEKIKLVVKPISVGGKDVMFDIGEEKRVIPQNLTALLARKRRDEYNMS